MRLVDLAWRFGLILAVACLFAWVGWLANGWRLDGHIAELEKQYAISLAIASNHANERYQKMEREKDEAIKAHALLASENKRAADAARATADGLRSDLAKVRASIATAAESAVREYAIAASDVLEQCTAEVVELAAKADGHSSDVRLMREAWPK